MSSPPFGPVHQPCRSGVPSASRGGANAGRAASSLSQLADPGCFFASPEERPCAAAGVARIPNSADAQHAVFTRGRISGIQLADWTHFYASFTRRRNLRRYLDRLVQMVCVHEVEAGQLLLRLGEGTGGHQKLA